MADRPTCWTCRHWRPEWEPFPDEGPDEVLGSCRALDPQTLPYGWRWAPREVVWTRGDEPPQDVTCPRYEAR